jgi:hypothetical protein
LAELTTLGRAALVAVCFSVSLSLARVARGEGTGDPALAHELFDQGRALMERGDYDHACGKFEESRRLDPGGGGGTVLNLALCEEKRGRTGTAWALFRTARSLAGRDRREDRQQFADEHIAALTPRLSRLRIVVPTTATVSGLTVQRNGVALRTSEWGESLVVDPGTQIVEARAPGYRANRFQVTAPSEGETLTVYVPALKPLPSEPAKPSPPAVRRRPPTVAEVLVGGAGLTAMAVGTAFGLRAINRQGNADSLCPDYEHCDPQGITLSADAARDGRISTVTFVGGATLLAGAVVSYLFIGRTHVVQPATGASPFSMSIRF